MNRRKFIHLLGIAGILGPGWPARLLAANTPLIEKPIPSTGERIPVIGLGSSRTFNVGNDPVALDRCADVINNFFHAGGRLIDSSPMYGSSQATIGFGLGKAQRKDQVFSADKVWVTSAEDGPEQMEVSRQRWQVEKFDLMQVHNLVSWQEHLDTLENMKSKGSIRYIGITTSHGRRHEEMEKIMRSRELDFVQLSYNAVDREVEQRLLPIAQERGVAVIVNRPFRRGELIRQASRHPLPGWAREIDCKNWAQLLLKYIVSHPAVTCAIPATTRVGHVLENMQAATGKLPGESTRGRIAAYVNQF